MVVLYLNWSDALQHWSGTVFSSGTEIIFKPALSPLLAKLRHSYEKVTLEGKWHFQRKPYISFPDT